MPLDPGQRAAATAADTAAAAAPAAPAAVSHSHPADYGSYMWDLDAGFKQRLQAFVKASGGRISLLSGYRSNEHQQRLYDAGIKKHGAANVGRWVAPPGRSNHNRGLAGDLSFHDDGAKAWAHQNAAGFGLEFPMGHEPWHIEPTGLAGGKYDQEGVFAVAREAYTPFDGETHPSDNAMLMTQPDQVQSYADVVRNALRLGPNTDNDGGLASEERIDDGGGSF